MPIFLPLFRPYIKKVTTPELFPKLMLATAAKPEAEPRSLLKGIILTKPVNKNQVDSDVCPRFNHLVLSFWCFRLPPKSSTGRVLHKSSTCHDGSRHGLSSGVRLVDNCPNFRNRERHFGPSKQAPRLLLNSMHIKRNLESVCLMVVQSSIPLHKLRSVHTM